MAEGLYRQGSKVRDIALIDQAAMLFPFRHYLRSAPGYMAIRLGLNPSESLSRIDRALATNPFSADLTAFQLDRLVQLGRFDEATMAFDRLRHLVPRSALVMNVCGENADCRVRFVAAGQQ